MDTEGLRREDDRRISSIEARLDRIENNHLAHIEKDLALVSNDMDWLKRFFWILATASIGSLATNLVAFLV